MISAGVADSRVLGRSGGQSVLSELRAIQALRGRSSSGVRGAPMRWFDPTARHSQNRVLLIGDAAGAEPLFGEGISTALEFGILAADAVALALAESEFSFSRYDCDVIRTGLGRSLSMKVAIARRFYAAPKRWPYIPLAWPSRRLSHALAHLCR
jgi:flavin-dependent dehydrogenase